VQGAVRFSPLVLSVYYSAASSMLTSQCRLFDLHVDNAAPGYQPNKHLVELNIGDAAILVTFFHFVPVFGLFLSQT
jgi:hypothetical protein